MATESNRFRKAFRPSRLPWLIGAVGLLIYLITLNPWISLHSLDAMDQVAGPVWQSAMTQPLTWLVLTVFRSLPEAAAPLALNLFTAICAGLILVLLARTVSLLPQSRGDERSRSKSPIIATGPASWIPPVLAAMACGLQLTFWECATLISGEIIDLLLFAYIIRCLFEFRADGDQWWLSTCALLQGIGMANNWVMFWFFPVLIIAIIWLKRAEFFTAHFIARMGLWWLTGLSFYFLLPVVHGLSPEVSAGFWTSLKINVLYQAEILLDFPRWTLKLLALTSLFPLLMLALCRRPEKKEIAGDNAFAVFLGRFSLRAAHGLFLLLALWMVLDLSHSPRRIGFGQPLLAFYYLDALILGYCARYFLLTGLGRFHGDSPLSILVKLTAKIGAYWTCLLLMALPVELLSRNFGGIWLTNGPILRHYAEALYLGLPSGKSVVLSDRPEQLILLEGTIAAHHHDKNALLVDLTAFRSRQYQVFMARKFGARWPAPSQTNAWPVIGRAALADQISRFAAREPVACLNPNFGYDREGFADQPNGLDHDLKSKDSKFDAASADANEHFWQTEWSGELSRLTIQGKPPPPPKFSLAQSMVGQALAAREENLTAAFLRLDYARALDDWGVQLQRLGRWHEAGIWFARALELKPDNLSAHINQLYNAQHERGELQRLDMLAIEKTFPADFDRYASWERGATDNGPVDEPTFLNETARVLLFKRCPRQAVSDYARCVELAPDWLEPKLWLSQSLDAVRDFDGALKLTDDILPKSASMDGMQLGQLLYCRFQALAGLGRTNEAAQCLADFTRDHAEQDMVLTTAVNLCVRAGWYEAALTHLDQMLERHPGNAELMSDKAFAQMQMAKGREAVASLTAAISVSPTNQIFRLNRALAFMQSSQWNAARGDYQEVLKQSPDSWQVLLGLQEIAWREKDTAAAIRYCEQYLAVANPRSFEYNLISNRLQKLKSEKR